MGGDQVSGDFYLERKYCLSYHCLSPRWLRFRLLLDRGILPDQRGFFNFIPLTFSINRGIGVIIRINIPNQLRFSEEVLS
jgi:hypothetical protein